VVHLTVPKSARLRRQRPKGVVLHREDVIPEEIAVQEGIPVTTVGRTVTDLLRSGGRVDLVRQAISDARREGFISESEARQLRRQVEMHLKSLNTPGDRMEPAIP
jgi:hypothetical protein